MALSKKDYELALSAEKGHPVSLSDDEHKQLTAAPIEDLGGDDRPTDDATKKADAAKWNSSVEDLGGDDRPTTAATKQADAMRWGNQQQMGNAFAAARAKPSPWGFQMAQQQQAKAMSAPPVAAPTPQPTAAPVYANPWQAAQAEQGKRMSEASELDRLYQIAFGGNYGKY
jgi:hypothetical protein